MEKGLVKAKPFHTTLDLMKEIRTNQTHGTRNFEICADHKKQVNKEYK